MSALGKAVLEAHSKAALDNQNQSSVAVQLAAAAGVPFHQAVAAALATLGGLHGPVTQARRVIFYRHRDEIVRAIESGLRIPGWGNSFHKDGTDPAWLEVEQVLSVEHPEHWQQLHRITLMLKKYGGVVLYPNAAAFTAVAAEVLGSPLGTELSLFLVGRVGAWAELYARHKPPLLFE